MTSIAYRELSVSRITPPCCSVITARTGDVANTSGASSCSITVRRTAYGTPGVGGNNSSPSTTCPSSSISGRPLRVPILRILTCSLNESSLPCAMRVAIEHAQTSRRRRCVPVEDQFLVAQHEGLLELSAELLGDPSRRDVIRVDEARRMLDAEIGEHLAQGLSACLSRVATAPA